jgi:hypothetical protein
MIDQHNLKASMGVYSYTLKMNQFGDMVNLLCLSVKTIFSFVSIDK